MNQNWFEPEEWVMGALVSTAFAYFTGVWSFVTIPLCAFLWRLGGIENGNKMYRRLGVPAVLSLFLAATTSYPYYMLLSGACAFGALSMGYGIPDATDEGSFLGKFWLRVTHDTIESDVLTRGTVGLMLGLCYLPLAWTNTIAYIVSVTILIIGMPFVERTIE